MTVKSTKTVAIIGQGYVGLPLAVAAATAGWKVIGVDSLESKVAKINSGSSPVEDVSDYVLRDFLSQNLYEATTDFSRVGEANVIVICVPTPLNDLREPDLKLLINATERIAQFAADETLIVTESTSFPGTLREIIIPIFIHSESQAVRKLYFATAPERVNPGDTNWNQKNTPRLVGAIDDASQEKALAFYESICDAVISVSTPEVAEAAVKPEGGAAMQLAKEGGAQEPQRTFEDEMDGLDALSLLSHCAVQLQSSMPNTPVLSGREMSWGETSIMNALPAMSLQASAPSSASKGSMIVRAAVGALAAARK